MGDETRAARACRPCAGVHGRGKPPAGRETQSAPQAVRLRGVIAYGRPGAAGRVPTCGRLLRWAAGWGRYGVWPAAVSEGGGIQSGAMSSKEV